MAVAGSLFDDSVTSCNTTPFSQGQCIVWLQLLQQPGAVYLLLSRAVLTANDHTEVCFEFMERYAVQSVV